MTESKREQQDTSSADKAPEGVMTRARVAPAGKDTGGDDETVTLTSAAGTKIKAPARMADNLRAQGYK